jgi:hypothetical protein
MVHQVAAGQRLTTRERQDTLDELGSWLKPPSVCTAYLGDGQRRLVVGHHASIIARLRPGRGDRRAPRRLHHTSRAHHQSARRQTLTRTASRRADAVTLAHQDQFTLMPHSARVAPLRS